MSCAFPVEIYNKKYVNDDGTHGITVPCGRCLSCREVKQSQLQFLAEKDLLDYYQRGSGSTFVTLTYNESNVPLRVRFGDHASAVVHGFDELKKLHDRVGEHPAFRVTDYHYTLVKKDLQKFMKRFRIDMQRDGVDIPFKFIACGEYGSEKGRCHYHLVLMGLDSTVCEKYLRKAWNYGIIDVGPLLPGGLRYVTKYITKGNCSPEVREIYEKYDCEREFLVHSIGFGKKWIKDHLEELLDDPFLYVRGKRLPVPKHILAMLKKLDKDVIRRAYQSELSRLYRAAGCNYAKFLDQQKEKAVLKEAMLARAALFDGVAVDQRSLTVRVYRPSVSRLVHQAMIC